MIREKLDAQLRIDEGERNKLYLDTVGKWSGGVGRNFSDRAMSPALIQFMLDEDVALVEHELDRNAPWWRELCDARQNVLANMCFNMGWPKLSAFRKFLAALRAKQYDLAADEMMDSLWAKQVGDRAKRLEKLMRGGHF
jgi:GH24 family phage-related lysozyme (muramidase)